MNDGRLPALHASCTTGLRSARLKLALTPALGSIMKIFACGLAALLLPTLAAACSPSLISPLAVMDPQARGADRFAHIVLAEVVATRSPGRIAALRAWQEQVRDVEAVNAQTAARDAQLRANFVATPGGPPLPPPEPLAPQPVLDLAIDLRVEVELFVVERFLGEGPAELQVSAGGQCGSIPKVGQQLLAFIEHNGNAHLLSRPGESGHLRFDEAYLQQVRDCTQRGDCPGQSNDRLGH